MKIKLRIGYEQARVHQDFQTLALILSKAFGGDNKDGKGKGREPRTIEEAQSLLSQVLGKV